MAGEQLTLGANLNIDGFGGPQQDVLSVRSIIVDFENGVILADLRGTVAGDTPEMVFSGKYPIENLGAPAKPTINGVTHNLVAGNHLDNWLSAFTTLEQETLQQLVNSGYFSGIIS